MWVDRQVRNSEKKAGYEKHREVKKGMKEVEKCIKKHREKGKLEHCRKAAARGAGRRMFWQP